MFQQKKIKQETLGEYLSHARSVLGLSLEEAAKKVGMSPEFLNLLEKGDYKKLPAKAYIVGFISGLSEIYSVSKEELLEQFEKERMIYLQLNQGVAAKQKKIYAIFRDFELTPKLAWALFGFIFFMLVALYIIWQIVSVNKTPMLEILSPVAESRVLGNIAEVEGRTTPGASVFINGENVFVDDKGHFKTQVSVNQGVKDLVFVARTRFDKSAEKTVKIFGSEISGSAERVALVLNFNNSAEINYQIDNGESIKQTVSRGGSLNLAGNQKISFSLSDGGAVSAELNGETLGILGKSGEPLLNVSFSLENAKINSSIK